MALSSSPDVRAWEPGSFRSHQRFHAFQHLRDLPLAERSTLRALNEHRIGCLKKPAASQVNGRWKAWSVEDDWRTRLELWDSEVDRQRREKFVKEPLAATERHQRMVQAAQQALAMQLRVALDLTHPPTAFAELKASDVGGVGLQRALTEARHAIALIPSVIETPRLIVGLTTSIGELREGPRRDDLADRIAGSEELTSLAIELLDKAARATPTPD